MDLEERYQAVQRQIHDLVKDTCETNKWIFDDRIKEVESYALKLMSGRYQSYQVDDFYACTIVVPNLIGVPAAIELIGACFEVIEEKPGAEILSRPTEFNFDSVRLYCRLKASVKKQPIHDLDFEVQIKTLLEHAWSKATHDFSYKGSDVSWAKERLSAQIKAILDNADLAIYEMEAISSSRFLDKKNPRYEKLKSIVEILKSQFDAKHHSLLVKDCKRLAENVDQVLKRTRISLEELCESLEKETAEGRGANIVNLSIYSVILLSLIRQYPDRVIAAFKKNVGGRPPKITVIPSEVMEEWDVDFSTFKHVTVLGSSVNA